LVVVLEGRGAIDAIPPAFMLHSCFGFPNKPPAVVRVALDARLIEV
jgi:hypothetical protein